MIWLGCTRLLPTWCFIISRLTLSLYASQTLMHFQFAVRYCLALRYQYNLRQSFLMEFSRDQLPPPAWNCYHSLMIRSNW